MPYFQDGMLDADEFALAMHLVNIKVDGHDLPSDLPAHLAKERIAVAGEGWSAEIDNWRSLRSQNLPSASTLPTWLGGPARGKGHAEALAAFLAHSSPVSLDEIEEVSRWSIRMQGMKA